jgi:hypothetical protein
MSNDQQYAAPFRDRKSSNSNMHIHGAVTSTGTCSVALRCSTFVTISATAWCWSRPPRPYCAAALPAELIALKRFSERTNLSLERLHKSAYGHCSHAATNGCNGSLYAFCIRGRAHGGRRARSSDASRPRWGSRATGSSISLSDRFAPRSGRNCIH